jgi:hypothetical protein
MPIMAPNAGAKLGRKPVVAISAMPENAAPRPNSAMRMGTPAATIEPNAMHKDDGGRDDPDHLGGAAGLFALVKGNDTTTGFDDEAVAARCVDDFQVGLEQARGDLARLLFPADDGARDVGPLRNVARVVKVRFDFHDAGQRRYFGVERLHALRHGRVVQPAFGTEDNVGRAAGAGREVLRKQIDGCLGLGAGDFEVVGVFATPGDSRESQ